MVMVTTSASSIFLMNFLEEAPNILENVLLAINGPVVTAVSSNKTNNEALYPPRVKSGLRKTINRKARTKLRVVDIQAMEMRVVTYRV